MVATALAPALVHFSSGTLFQRKLNGCQSFLLASVEVAKKSLSTSLLENKEYILSFMGDRLAVANEPLDDSRCELDPSLGSVGDFLRANIWTGTVDRRFCTCRFFQMAETSESLCLLMFTAVNGHMFCSTNDDQFFSLNELGMLQETPSPVATRGYGANDLARAPIWKFPSLTAEPISMEPLSTNFAVEQHEQKMAFVQLLKHEITEQEYRHIPESKKVIHDYLYRQSLSFRDEHFERVLLWLSEHAGPWEFYRYRTASECEQHSHLMREAIRNTSPS